ncbi:ATP-binding protein [Nocardioides sp. CER19]|uniref:sensor histidine kinase n=1 Tax=Nocardioides sp. CER19 TaxID=3038538 RepID=UPI002448A355|nr:ATP-binding protein [Nocardioides sp. CER19]MDH2413308.1 ATP-binding protein [Nocardioides sp. CER19]
MTRPTSSAPSAASWSEQSFRDALQIIAEGLAELVGFGMVVLSVRQGDDLVVVAVAGTAGGQRADGTVESVDEMLGARWPVAHLEALVDVAESWGRFQFVRHDRAPRGNWVWVREPAAVEGDGAWHPNDGAIAPIHDATGELVGAISVDEPRTGRYPDAAHRRVMDRYAEEAAGVMISALEREALEGRLALAESARLLLRTASRHLSLDTLLDETGPAFLEAFAAAGLWLRIMGSAETLLPGSRHQLPVGTPSQEVADNLSLAAEGLWEHQRAAIVYVDGRSRNTVLDDEATDVLRALVRETGFGSVLHAPIGAGSECLGSLVMAREPGQPDWSGAELDLATEVARDLGRIIRNGQTYTRVQELVRELRELDAHKSRLIAMISHELKNPLTVLLANGELLEAELDGDPAALARLADVDANAHRMGRVVDNLLLLSKLADPDTPLVERDVDLRPVFGQVEAAFAASMGQRRITLRTTLPEEPLVVRGDPTELRTMLANVIGNGIKFSDDGSQVDVVVTASRDAVEVTVVDHGIGISPEDQGRLFTSFFRSQDPAALTRPGSGLGLGMVDRILRRHGGRAEVRSTLGQGTTVRIVLPVRTPDEGH